MALVTFGWVGGLQASASVKKVDGEVVARNLYRTPDMRTSVGSNGDIEHVDDGIIITGGTTNVMIPQPTTRGQKTQTDDYSLLRTRSLTYLTYLTNPASGYFTAVNTTRHNHTWLYSREKLSPSKLRGQNRGVPTRSHESRAEYQHQVAKITFCTFPAQSGNGQKQSLNTSMAIRQTTTRPPRKSGTTMPGSNTRHTYTMGRPGSHSNHEYGHSLWWQPRRPTITNAAE